MQNDSVLDAESLEKKRRTDVYIRASKLLMRREHTERELRLKLQRAGCEQEYADAAIVRLLDEGLLSDDRFADQFTGERFRKGYGELDILSRLAKRGIGRQMAQRALRDFVAGENICWYERAVEVLCNRFGVDPLEADARELAKDEKNRHQWGTFLKRRGFTDDQVLKALREFH